MKTTTLFVMVLFFVLITSVSATWCDTDFAKRINVSVDNTGGGALTDYQIYVNLSSNPINETSLRVYNSTSCALRPHWCENETGGNCYGIWINYGAVAASLWINNTAIYYNNITASSVSSGTATFDFFDDFPGSSIDATKWEDATDGASVSNSIMTYQKNMCGMNTIVDFDDPSIVRSRTKFTTTSGNVDSFGFVDRAAVRYCYLQLKAGFNQFNVYDGAWEIHTTNIASNTFCTYEIQWISATSAKAYKNSTLMENGTITIHVPTESLPVEFYTQTGASILSDWVLIRKYTSLEPSTTLGNEEQEHPYSISGYVKSPSGNPIASVYVTNNITSTTNYTNASGYYILGELSNLSTYNISASKSEYHTNYTVNTISGANITNQNVTLIYHVCHKPSTPINLQNTTDSTWINWTWQAATGNITDSFNVSIAGSGWTNDSSNTFYNRTNMCAGQSSTIIVYAFNNSREDCISDSNVINTQTLETLSWADTDYAYRVIACVQNITTGHYQIDFNLHTGIGANNATDIFMNNHNETNNYDDVRIYNITGVMLSYWIENVSDDPTKLWINATENGSVQIYYGHSGASSTSNGTNTFEFFDDFTGASSGVWDRYGAVISDVSTCEPNVIYDTNPQILTGETQVFKMWYRYGWTTSYIYYAESTDGKSWSQYSGNPVISNYICPFVFKHDSMYYFFGPQSSDMNSLHRWNSTDGVNWTDEGIVLSKGASGQWDDCVLATSTVWIENVSDWKILYDAKQNGGPWQVGLATSTDGLTWTKEPTNPVISETGSVVGSAYSMNGSDITKYNGYYYIWLQRSPTGSVPTDINRYRSTDLTTWERSPNANTFPRLGTDEGAGTSIGQVADPALWEHNGQVYLWYAASSNGGAESGNMHIKLAIADTTFTELIATNEGNLAQGIDTNKWEGSTSGATISNNILTYQKNTDGMNTIINFDDPCILRSRTNFTSIATYLCGHGFVNRSAVRYCWFNLEDGANKFSVYDGAWAITSTNITADTFHTYEIHWKSSSTAIFKDNVEMLNSPIIIHIPTSSLPIEVYTQTGASISHDWILVHKYASQEPSTTLGSEEDAPATTPVISNVQNGSISSTSQWIDWDVNQTSHNRVLYSNESDLTPAYYSSWENSTNAPNITLSGLDASTQYWYQVWSYNTTNTSLSDNSSTMSFTTAADTTPILHIDNAINLKEDWGRDFSSNLSANVTTANASGVWMKFTNAEFTNTSLGNLNLTLDEWVNESHNVNAPVINVSVTVFLNAPGATNDTDSFWYEVTKRTNTATMDSAATQNVDISENFYVNATCNEEYSNTFYGAATLLEDGAIVATDSSVIDYVNFSHSESVAGQYNYTIRFYNLTHYDNATTPTYSNVTVSDAEYIPPDATTLANTTGNFWVNHTWSMGILGNITNSYNVSVNLTWYNGTTNLYYNNTPLSAHKWSNVSIWGYNTSGSGTLSAGNISQNTQIPNNVPVLSGLPNNTTTEDVNQTDIFDLDSYFSDADSDTPTFLVESNNESAYVSVTINASNNVSYTLASGWNGTASVVINVTDGWEGEDNDTFLIIVNAATGDYIPDDPTTLANTTGNYWVNFTWSSCGGANITDSYNVSWNLTWYNTTLTAYMQKEVGVSNWGNITVYAYNSSGNGSLSAGYITDEIQAPVAAATVPCTQGDICVNITGWWRHNAVFNATNTQIQYAINNASTGDTLYVFAGTYNENIIINKAITLNGSNVGISGVGARAAESIIDAANGAIYVIEITTNNATINGFTISGLTGSGENIGTVMIQGKDYCTITNNILTGNYKDGVNLFATGGQYSDYNIVSNNLITSPNAPSGGGAFAIKIKGSNNTITNNTITNGWRWAIHLWSYDTSETVSPDHNEITNNTITGTGVYDERGIVCKTGAYTKLLNNTITGIIYAPIYFYTSDRIVGETDFDPRPHHCTISDNIITGGEAGIALLEGCNNFTISDNTITGGTVEGKITQAGILAGLSRWTSDWVGKTLGYTSDTNYLNYLQITDNAISNNNITNCGHGVAMQYSDRNNLTANIIINNTNISAIDWWSINTELVFIADYAGVYFDANSDNNIAHYNNIVNNTGGLKNANTTTTLDAKNNWWDSCSGPSGAGTGTGDNVSVNVSFSPWLCEAYPTTWNSPCYLVSNPTNLQHTTGDGWVNYTWDAGSGNITNSYNVSWNLTWHNNTLVPYMNDTVGVLGWANISVWAFNNSCGGNLSVSDVSDNVQTSGDAFTSSMTTSVYNLITYYGSSTSTAEQFGLDIGDVGYVCIYNGSFYSHTMGYTSNNFTTYHGIGYYVYLNSSGSSTYQRNNIPDVPYNTQLYNRWNTVGWTNSTNTNAEGIATSIGSACKYTSMLNADGVTYTTHTVGFTSNNHAVNKGQGYWVWVNTGVNWGRNS